MLLQPQLKQDHRPFMLLFTGHNNLQAQTDTPLFYPVLICAEIAPEQHLLSSLPRPLNGLMRLCSGSAWCGTLEEEEEADSFFHA